MRGEAVSHKEAKFEDVLDVIGHFRPYQWVIYFLLYLPEFGAAMCMVFFVFAHANPGWRCLQYATSGEVLNYTTIPATSSPGPVADTNPNISWVTDDSQCNLNGLSCVAFAYKLDYTSVITEWNLICSKAFIPQLAVSVQFVGLTLGSAFSGYLSDTYGRRWPGLIGNTLMLLTHAVNGFSPNYYVYLFMRFALGFFAGSPMVIYFLYPQEFTGPRWRMILGQFTFFGVGHAFLSLLAFYVRDWRHLAFMSGIIPLVQIPLTLIFVPESPRWLIQKNKFRQAEAVVRRIAKNNCRPVPDMAVLRAVARSSDVSDKRQYSYLDLYRNNEMRKRTLALTVLWFTIAEIYYGVMVQVNSLSGNIYINSTILALSSYPIAWLGLPIFNKLNRRISLVVMLSTVLLFTMSIVVLSAAGVATSQSMMVTVIALADKALVTATWNLCFVFTVELYPTLIRNIGYSHSNIACRIGATLAPQFALLGIVTHWVMPYAIHGALAVISAVLVIVCLPDTNDKPLTESITGRDLNADVHQDEAAMTVLVNGNNHDRLRVSI